jgi:hypothetical protein
MDDSFDNVKRQQKKHRAKMKLRIVFGSSGTADVFNTICYICHGIEGDPLQSREEHRAHFGSEGRGESIMINIKNCQCCRLTPNLGETS